MTVEDVKVIELGSVSGDTRGNPVGRAESDSGFLQLGGLTDD